jgi:hypothetical protein
MRSKILFLCTLASVISACPLVGAQSLRGGNDMPRRDISKGVIERPLEKSLMPAFQSIPAAQLPPTLRPQNHSKLPRAHGNLPETAADGFINPKVEPGQVIWRADFEQACASSKLSGKPVLLFQMMGKLDDGFC